MDKPRTNSLLRIVVKVALVIAAGQLLFWTAVAPPRPDVEIPEPGEVTFDGKRAELGQSSLERRDGYWFFTHGGPAHQLGMEHAAIGGFLIQRVEDEMFETFQRSLPWPLQIFLPPFLLWSYRHMAKALPQEQLEELWGFSTTYADRHSFPLGAYQRGLYYHALHDITQELVGNPWVDPAVAGACTAFAASGDATTNGNLILGRNFDFEVFPLFDEEKVVHLFAREGAIPVLSISWMAMAGVVSGMNAHGIWMSVNSARAEGHNRKGPSVSLWMRSILENARSIDEVEALLLAKEPLVTDIYLVGDGKTGEAVVFERGPGRLGKRGMVDGRLTASNHLLTKPFLGDPKDAGLRRHSSTLARGLRMDELVKQNLVSPERGVAMLRDRKGAEGLPIGPGNRNAIDALIATHSVVADATDRVLWVSTAPHTQGAYRAIDMLAELEAMGHDTSPYREELVPSARAWEKAMDKTEKSAGPTEGEAELSEHKEAVEEASSGQPPQDIPSAPFFSDGGYERLLRYRGFVDDAEAYLDHGDLRQALDLSRRAQILQPNSAEAYRVEAEVHAEAGRIEDAKNAYMRYFAKNPAFGPKTSRSRAWLEEQGKPLTWDRPDTPPPDSGP